VGKGNTAPADAFALNGKPCLPGGSQFAQSMALLNAARSARRRRGVGVGKEEERGQLTAGWNCGRESSPMLLPKFLEN
jgi:hypothetical protein